MNPKNYFQKLLVTNNDNWATKEDQKSCMEHYKHDYDEGAVSLNKIFVGPNLSKQKSFDLIILNLLRQI
jgi:hypothetical protein